MRKELGQCPFERAFPEQDELEEAFLFHRSYPSLREGIQIWGARGGRRRQRIPSDASTIVERRTEFGIPVVQHVTTLPEPSRRVVDDIPRPLRDPGLCRMPGDAAKGDAPALQIEEERTS
jgi:hypothetical protein